MRFSDPSRIVLGVVLLAAGASSRMGRPKLLLPWGQVSVLGHLKRLWQELGSRQFAVVCAPDMNSIHDELDRSGVSPKDRIVNPDPGRGMFSSIQSAARWQGWDAALTHWAVVLGDQPQVSIQTLRTLLEFAEAHPQQVCQPSRQGRPRHPVILPKDAFQRLVNASDENLKQFLQNLGEDIARCEIDDPGLDVDLDTPADYDRALRIFLNT